MSPTTRASPEKPGRCAPAACPGSKPAGVELPDTYLEVGAQRPGLSGSSDTSVGHALPGRVGGWPPRLSMASAMRAWGERNPKAIRVIRRILVLTDSMRPLDRPCSMAARIDALCLTMRF